MSQKMQVHASLRVDAGKGASRRLRRAGDKFPAIIYGAGLEAQPLTLGVHAINKAMESEAFFSQIIDVHVDGNPQQALVRDVQRHPASGKVLHMDFLRVRADTEIEVHVPLHFIGEEECVGVRLGGGTVTHLMTDIEIRCLPADLPEYIEVDVTNLDLNELIHLSEVKVPAGVVIMALEHEDDDRAVVSIQPPRVETEQEPVQAAGEVPTVSDDKGDDA